MELLEINSLLVSHSENKKFIHNNIGKEVKKQMFCFSSNYWPNIWNRLHKLGLFYGIVNIYLSAFLSTLTTHLLILP
jgi:hypothetical protein